MPPRKDAAARNFNDNQALRAVHYPCPQSSQKHDGWRRSVQKTLWAILLVTLTACAPASARADTLVVLEKSSFHIALINPATGKVLADLPTGRGPHEVATSPDGHTAYVSNFGRFDVFPSGDQTHTRPGNTITVINVPDRKVKTTFQLGTYTGPHGILVSHNGRYVWVTVETPQSLLELDADTGKVLHVWRTRQQRSHMVVTSTDEKTFYVTNTVSGSVSIINRTTGAVKVVPIGPGAEGIAISPDGREVWIACQGNNRIAVLETASDNVVANFPSGGARPVRVRFTPDGNEVWVTDAGSGLVSIFDARTRKLLGTVHVGATPGGFVFSPDGRRAYISNASLNHVTFVDVPTRKVHGTLPTGTEPDGIAWAAPR
jgi:YVTN family beta-propeller protein